jgi:hypothetical protein
MVESKQQLHELDVVLLRESRPVAIAPFKFYVAPIYRWIPLTNLVHMCTQIINLHKCDINPSGCPIYGFELLLLFIAFCYY